MFHPAITLGACAGAQTTTAVIGAITEAAKSQVPVLGYTGYVCGRDYSIDGLGSHYRRLL
ncbi:hypothetical protein O9H85_26115 [Paenibacillus filicis]|uniref:YidE/YbjL duplication domain-containing protein n=1 Tax=Paenibacillus gyeongsangnamensis TaxID=3388067 RepID=A0ABT4QG40_9BACL|nr:hypothetical protein [Paenibacillus filicis]MCZ8515825.1 hypothetical protein [Paenibacillus filicis]